MTTGITYSSVYEAILQQSPLCSRPFKNFNSFINSLFLPHSLAVQVVHTFGTHTGYYILSYLRNLMAGMIMYYVTAGIFHYHCYIHPRSKDIFSDRPRPTRATILDQIQLAQASLFMYVGLPVLSDFLVEEGYTKCYYSWDEIGGLIPYLFWTLIYFSCVEIGIYWMHRTLHENKFLYKYIHMLHHKYSRPDTLTPWASIAFNPLDGILQACPYVYLLPIIPCHYLTHVVFLFFTAVWATYIHDAMDWNMDPIMGSKYHTIHHTHYIYNYGQVFTFCDRIWGTLRVPVGKTGVLSGPQKVTLLPAKPGWFGGSGRGKSKSI
jgi:lathosterol oxidase